MAHSSSSANLTVSNLFSFKDHVVLITGGATGLGEMAAQGYVQNGARVIIASRKQKELEATSSRLNKVGPGSCDFVVADLKDRAGCDHLCQEVKKKTDRLTVLLNNSGATWYIYASLRRFHLANLTPGAHHTSTFPSPDGTKSTPSMSSRCSIPLSDCTTYS